MQLPGRAQGWGKGDIIFFCVLVGLLVRETAGAAGGHVL